MPLRPKLVQNTYSAKRFNELSIDEQPRIYSFVSFQITKSVIMHWYILFYNMTNIFEENYCLIIIFTKKISSISKIFYICIRRSQYIRTYNRYLYYILFILYKRLSHGILNCKVQKAQYINRLCTLDIYRENLVKYNLLRLKMQYAYSIAHLTLMDSNRKHFNLYFEMFLRKK